ncbi:unnamed protein product [Arabidopsis halleri]
MGSLIKMFLKPLLRNNSQLWNPSTFFASIMNYSVPNQPDLSASCTNKVTSSRHSCLFVTKETGSDVSDVSTIPTQVILDISLPIFDTSSKPQKEGIEERPIYDTATKSSGAELSFCSARRETSRPEFDVKSPPANDHLDGDQDSAKLLRGGCSGVE